MEKTKEKAFYEEIGDWDFSKFEIESECLTKWDLYELLNQLANRESRILDLGTGGGEKLLKSFPIVKEILGTDFSDKMIETANKNLKLSGRKDVKFRIMDNLNMDVPDNYFDIVVARNTVTDPQQIYKCLKEGGYLLLRGVDKDDCWSLKLLFGSGQGYNDKKPISLVDYENVIKAGFKDIELVPIHVREYFKNGYVFKDFLKKTPIIDQIDDKFLDYYIKNNTYNGKIRLLRRYYGIIARK
jgi:SAM-dependent methyltransferase